MKYKYKYYQLPLENDGKFMSYDFITRNCKGVHKADYHPVYYSEIEDTCPQNALEKLFCIFNIEHPKDYHAHSMSVSDVVVLSDEDDAETIWFCDSFGWKEISIDEWKSES